MIPCEKDRSQAESAIAQRRPTTADNSNRNYHRCLEVGLRSLKAVMGQTHVYWPYDDRGNIDLSSSFDGGSDNEESDIESGGDKIDDAGATDPLWKGAGGGRGNMDDSDEDEDNQPPIQDRDYHLASRIGNMNGLK